ncbi:hypothetical protein BHM03_00034900 [Ensete ventricosum]|uniref:Uncharacterized protein n=1 Tax=Ensete ventricosum TaxID=4639 RepID=A0A445MJ90_ENSVE|nr:hypothetical protein BHM03_00034900 [Ensete ventricosum]
MNLLHQNEERIERHDRVFASVKVHILNLYRRKASHLCSIFHLLYQLPSYDLRTSPNSTQVASLFCLH